MTTQKKCTCTRCGETDQDKFTSTQKNIHKQATNNLCKTCRHKRYLEKTKDKIRLTPNERNTIKYTEKLHALFPHYDIIDYIGSQASTYFRCNIHNCEFKAMTDGLLITTPATRSNKHCPECQAEAKTIKYKEELDSLNIRVKIIGQYKDREIPIAINQSNLLHSGH